MSSWEHERSTGGESLRILGRHTMMAVIIDIQHVGILSFRIRPPLPHTSDSISFPLAQVDASLDCWRIGSHFS